MLNARKPYPQGDVDEIYLEYGSPGYHSQENLERLATKFGRSTTAISFLFSWVGKVQSGLVTFPPKARNRILRQVLDAHRRLGRKR